MSHIETTLTALAERFGTSILESYTFRDAQHIAVKRDALVQIAHFLRSTPTLDYNMMMDLTVADWWPEEPRFVVNYVLFALRHNTRLLVKVKVHGDDPVLPTLVGVWPNTNWYEREVFDMFGITFTDHPDLRRILMPEDWEGHPLRKDYPLGYEEVQFSFNWREIDAKKPYAKE